MWSALHPGLNMRATIEIRNIAPIFFGVVVRLGAEIVREERR